MKAIKAVCPYDIHHPIIWLPWRCDPRYLVANCAKCHGIRAVCRIPKGKKK